MPKVLAGIEDVKQWVRNIFSDFTFDVLGFATRSGKIIPLNLEPGTLGNVIEGIMIAHIKEKVKNRQDIKLTEGGNRFYPDIELTGSLFADSQIAVDIKAARRSEKNPNRTQSRITLYSFGTYLKHQDIKFSQTIRPFSEYKHHLDIIAVFDVNKLENSIGNFKLLVVEPWKVASKTLSSGTRDYVGAIMEIDKIEGEKSGEFKTQQEFYDYWAAVPRRGSK